MSQVTDWDVDNSDGGSVRSQMNGILAALRTSSSGPTAPSPTAAGMLWWDEGVSPATLRIRNQANTAWEEVRPGFGLSNITLLTSGSGTYSTPTNCRALLVRLIGGGGGAGGVNGLATGVGASGGGQAGCESEMFITSPAASYTYAVGAAGAGAPAGGGDGSAGGDTTFTDGGSVNITAGGGEGGDGMTATTGSGNGPGGTTGTATGGDLNLVGQEGQRGLITVGTISSPGLGGSSSRGGGGRNSGNNADGFDGTGYGAGGGGAIAVNDATNRAGGAGTGGIIEIWEFY